MDVVGDRSKQNNIYVARTRKIQALQSTWVLPWLCCDLSQNTANRVWERSQERQWKLRRYTEVAVGGLGSLASKLGQTTQCVTFHHNAFYAHCRLPNDCPTHAIYYKMYHEKRPPPWSHITEKVGLVSFCPHHSSVCGLLVWLSGWGPYLSTVG